MKLPIVEALRTAPTGNLEMLFEAGPLYDDKIVQAVDQLIRDLRP